MDMGMVEDGGGNGAYLRLSSAVMFVGDLDRSVAFYRELLELDIAAHAEGATLLVSPGGYQLYLRRVGRRAEHPSGAIGVQYVVWAAKNEDELQRCERVLKGHSLQVSRHEVERFTSVEGRGPDGEPVIITYPGPEQAPRHDILERIYTW